MSVDGWFIGYAGHGLGGADGPIGVGVSEWMDGGREEGKDRGGLRIRIDWLVWGWFGDGLGELGDLERGVGVRMCWDGTLEMRGWKTGRDDIWSTVLERERESGGESRRLLCRSPRMAGYMPFVRKASRAVAHEALGRNVLGEWFSMCGIDLACGMG
ncbi:hypothetical protein EJ04DRAFT_304505 [Polyplosphaeria fusca]|uniref:Uncharacterized protein n=1 Tax=Polyplosphaeria fusca TaxID=682080 RepID=A0A9P4V154_9PLEO|nr:hypothetical protein EJ04DRAFT_304505 [Polyplosphaeria fusca]